MNAKEKTDKSYCASCNRKTFHDVAHEISERCTPDNTPGMEIDFWSADHQIVKCKGCGTYGFRRIVVCSEDFDAETGQPESSIESYPAEPPKQPSTRHMGEPQRRARSFPHAPPNPRRIYGETVAALNADLLTLTAGGLRAIIEALCNDKGITDGPVSLPDSSGTGAAKIVRKADLRGKIAGLAEKGILTAQHAEVLHEHRFLGNAALHELTEPASEALELALDIIEHTLENVYELSHHLVKLRRQRTGT